MRTPVLMAMLLVLAIGFSSSQAEDSSTALQAAFKTHCARCHGQDGNSEADVDLLAMRADDDFLDRPELLQDLLSVLKDRRMPPQDEPPLPEVQREQMVKQLQSILSRVVKNQPFIATPIRRMNRFQYNNAVVDLLQLDRDVFQLNERLLRRRDDYFRPESRRMPDQLRVSSRPLSKDIDNQRPEGFRGVAPFPQDKRAEHGFDNRADHLTLSPLLMESFLQLSQSIANSPDLNPHECRSWDQLFAAPGQPSSGPVGGRYEAEIDGLVQIVGTPPGKALPANMSNRSEKWSGDAQLLWRCNDKGLEMTLSIDVKQPASGIRFRFTTARDYGTFDIYLDEKTVAQTVDLFSPDVGLISHQVDNLSIEPGRHTLRFICVGKNARGKNHFFGLDYIELTGHQPGASANEEIVSDVDVIRSRLKRFLRLAFRRPVDPSTLDRFTNFTAAQLASGATFEQAMRGSVGAVIGMPDFLYLYEGEQGEQKPVDQNRGRQRITDFELASRLAQFFWSSIPDDPLLDLAESGRLSEPETLSAQIDRMMNDRRSARFCDNFPGQWLQLDRLITSIPDPKKFPYFYYNGYRTSMHMMSEPLLLFETVFVEDRSIIELLDPKFTWQSEMLGANYEGYANSDKDVQVQTFRRVPLDDPRRGGVITNAAVMTMTSTPTRTQPITRGAWINEVIFNDPPEPPPADVPPLPEPNAEELAKLTIRERLAVHRERADCAGCHDKIDPLGFALENYGPTGVWRDKYENGRAVDPSGVLFNQYEFASLVEFKRLIVQQKERFIRAFVAHLLSYSLGRQLGPADSHVLEEISEKAMAGDDNLRTVMKQVAMSEPFLHKSEQ